MDMQKNAVVRQLLRGAIELAAVTLLVFATGWTGVCLAERVHRHVVSPGPGGIIELRLVKSDRRGEVSFEEGPGYAGWWHCQGKDWAVEWRFASEATHRYSVEIRVSNPEHLAGEKIEVAIRDQSTTGDHKLQTVIPDTGGFAKWETLNLGEVSLEGRPYTLIVRPGSDGLTNLNVKSVTLRPTESKS